MEIEELQKIAETSRAGREIGIALFAASCLLGLLLLVPIIREKPKSAETVVTTQEIQDAFSNVQINAKAAIVYDLATDKILYAKNENSQLPLASLTKLLTVYAALQKLFPDTPITITQAATRTDYPRIFSVGQTFKLLDLARLTLTASLNDGAAAIAIATAAQENHSQAEMLAGAAAALGLSQTYAINGNGLDVSPAISGSYGSAKDLAHLAGALIKNSPSISEATTRSSVQAISKDGMLFNVKNTDPLVNTIPGLLLSKTGFTDLAGGNLALVFDSGIQHPIAVIVLGSSEKERFTDGAALVAATFAHFAGVASL